MEKEKCYARNKEEVRKNKEVQSINDEIRRLLFSYPNIEIPMVTKLLGMLGTMDADKREKLRAKLRKQVNTYKEVQKKETDSSEYDARCDLVRNRISQWEQEIGDLSIDDIVALARVSNTAMPDIAWQYINPINIRQMLDSVMVGQEEYKQALSTSIYIHLMRARNPQLNLPKSNLLAYGPSGVGKTSAVLYLCEMMNLTFCLMNMNSMVEEGIVGNTMTKCISAAMKKKDPKTTYLVIVLDEVDKVTEQRQALMQELLNLMDNHNYLHYTIGSNSQGEQMQLSTNQILCILCGRFASIERERDNRLGKNHIGFSQGTEDQNSSQKPTIEDIRKALNFDELSGRISHYAGLTSLTHEQLVDLLLNKSETALTRFQSYFRENGVELEITEEGANMLVDHVQDKYAELGVRGLETALWQLLAEEMGNVSVWKDKTITIDGDMMRHKINNY